MPPCDYQSPHGVLEDSIPGNSDVGVNVMF